MNRREALRALAAGSACGALAGGMAVTITPSQAAADPCLAFVRGWDAASDACDAQPDHLSDAFYDEHCAPFSRAAAEGTIPPATTAEGAAAALRKALSFGCIETPDDSLIRAALAFLEGRTA